MRGKSISKKFKRMGDIVGRSIKLGIVRFVATSKTPYSDLLNEEDHKKIAAAMSKQLSNDRAIKKYCKEDIKSLKKKNL